MTLACDADEFLTKVGYLEQPFDFNKVYDYTPPKKTDEAVPSEITQSLREVFKVAPPFFQQRLCELKALFIDKSDTTPWGYRENPKQFSFNLQPKEYGRYIAIPSFPFFSYSRYESAVLNHLLGWKIKVTTNIDSPTMMGLAVLAHEDGHILFGQTYGSNPEPYIRPEAFCYGQFFSGSWAAPVEVKAVKGISTYTASHRLEPQIKAIANSEDEYDSKQLVEKLFKSRSWVSLLAAYTPEHDFVETYKFVVLANAVTPLKSMEVLSTDLLAGFDSRQIEVGRKAGCFAWMKGE